MSDTYARVSAAAHSGAFGINEMQLPTAEQCRAGNYLKGRTTLHGMPVVIEVPQGQRRMGKSDGKPWSTILMAHYGYIAGTKGADADALDIFIGPVPESLRVWVVNQVSQDGTFDEHKILLGYIDEEAARAAYMNSYERGWTGLGSLVACSIEQLKWWVKYGNTTIPLTERALPHDGAQDMNKIVWDSVTAEPVGCDVADLIYGLRRGDSEGLLLDAVSIADIMEDSDGEEVLDALVVEYAKAERKAEQLRKIMDAMGGSLKAVAVQVTPPFKQRGTTNVVFLFELSDGQTISIFLHNPDSTPHRILPQDELVSWSWRLNKKDVSILVAPEKGQDLNPREVARRIMKLAERNSARFGKANATRAQRMESIEGLKGEVASKEATLAALDTLFIDLTEKVEAKRALPPKAELQNNDQEGASRDTFDPTTPEGYEQATRDESIQIAHQDQLDSFFQGRLVDVRNGLRDLGWDGIRNGSLTKTAGNGDVWTFAPRFKQVGGGANIVEFYPKLTITRDGNLKKDEHWETEDRLTLTAIELAALINSVVPHSGVAPVPVAAPEAFRHSGFNIYPFSGRWAVQTADNLEREQRGERQVGGDSIVDTKEAAIAQAELQASQMADLARRKLEADAADEAAAQALAEKNREYADIGDPDGETPMQRGRRVTALSGLIRHDGAVKTKKKMVEDLVASGADTGTFEENRLKPMSRAAFNRATQREQDDHARKVATGGKVTGYTLGDSIIDKTAYDYANLLISRREAPEPDGPNGNSHADRVEWEEQVYEAIEAEDITRSDAQGIVEAQGSMIDDLFAAGTQPADAAAAILAASTSIGSQDPVSIEGLGEVAANTGHDAEQTAARAFLQSVIDGGVDYFDPELVGKLEAIHDRYGSSDDVIELFNLAAQAFSDYMVAQAGAAN